MQMNYTEKVAFRVNTGKTFTLRACSLIVDYIIRKDRMPLYFDADDSERFMKEFGNNWRT